MITPQDLVPLGKTDMVVTTVGVGAWAWGDRMVWGYGGSSNTDTDIRGAGQIHSPKAQIVRSSHSWGTGTAQG